MVSKTQENFAYTSATKLQEALELYLQIRGPFLTDSNNWLLRKQRHEEFETIQQEPLNYISAFPLLTSPFPMCKGECAERKATSEI